MKIDNVGWAYFFDNTIIYVSHKDDKLNKVDLMSNEKVKIDIPSKVLSFYLYENNTHLLINTLIGSLLYDLEMKQVGRFYTGYSSSNRKFKNYNFSNSLIKNLEYTERIQWIFNENTKELTRMPIENDILFYVFHDRYFIPVTFPFAVNGASYGPDITVYNYQTEKVWSKDFRDSSTYINSKPQFNKHRDIYISNVKVWGDKLLVSTSTQHLLCYDIHTGHQIWTIDNFGSTNVHLVAFDPEEGTGFVVCSGEEGVFWSLYKIDLFEGKILAEKPIREWESSGFSNVLTSWTLTDEGLWTATQFTGKIGRINRDTLEIDLVYQIEEVRAITQSSAPHITKEFVMIADGWGSLEVIKR